jgi:hypothetical protein
VGVLVASISASSTWEWLESEATVLGLQLSYPGDWLLDVAAVISCPGRGTAGTAGGGRISEADGIEDAVASVTLEESR